MPALLVFLFASYYWCYINIGVLFFVFPSTGRTVTAEAVTDEDLK